MRISICFVSAAIILGCAGQITQIHNVENIAPAENIDEITLMTFNIRVGAGIESLGTGPHLLYGKEENYIKIAETIKHANADIIALQEVKGYNQAKTIAEKLGFNFVYASHGGSGWWGLAVLSKFKIEAIDSYQIRSDFDDPRTGLVCIFKINNKNYNIINVHYHIGDFNTQVKNTISLSKNLEGPKILMGDFNLKPYRNELSSIKGLYIDSCEKPNTVNSARADTRGTLYQYGYSRIDYIFIDSQKLIVEDAGLVPQEFWEASDHIAYWAKVKITK